MMALSLKYEVNRLSGDELAYELLVRGITGVETVDQMRKSLRSLLKLERASSPLEYPVYSIKFDEDVTVLRDKSVEIRELLDCFEGERDGPAHLKILSKLAWGLGRANRSQPKSPEEKSAKSLLIVELLNLHSEVQTKIRRRERSLINQSAVIPDLDMLTLENEGSSESEVEDLAVASPAALPLADSSHVAPSRCGSYAPVAKWNLKFSGDGTEMSLSAFLARVEELRVARHLSKRDLLDGAIDLLTGRALIWFRANRKRVDNWDALVALLRQQFQPADYNDRLFDEIRQRTQGPDEPMGIYLAVVENLFDRLTYEVPESTRLKIVLRNLDPFYQGQLGVRTINSFAELLEFGRMVEARRSIMESFRPPKKRHSRSLLEPDLAYEEAELAKPSKGSRKPAAVASTSSAAAGSSAGVICWNCRKSGHVKSACQAPKQLRCYQCGKQGFISKTCPDCSGNGRRGQ